MDTPQVEVTPQVLRDQIRRVVGRMTVRRNRYSRLIRDLRRMAKILDGEIQGSDFSPEETHEVEVLTESVKELLRLKVATRARISKASSGPVATPAKPAPKSQGKGRGKRKPKAPAAPKPAATDPTEAGSDTPPADPKPSRKRKQKSAKAPSGILGVSNYTCNFLRQNLRAGITPPDTLEEALAKSFGQTWAVQSIRKGARPYSEDLKAPDSEVRAYLARAAVNLQLIMDEPDPKAAANPSLYRLYKELDVKGNWQRVEDTLIKWGVPINSEGTP